MSLQEMSADETKKKRKELCPVSSKESTRHLYMNHLHHENEREEVAKRERKKRNEGREERGREIDFIIRRMQADESAKSERDRRLHDEDEDECSKRERVSERSVEREATVDRLKDWLMGGNCEELLLPDQVSPDPMFAAC